ncbi:MAG: hypothetical protein K8R38_09215 [Verrucomicrobia bacterium]|nr:hypothetical protein [Verrucomicrobiota bacterium]
MLFRCIGNTPHDIPFVIIPSYRYRYRYRYRYPYPEPDTCPRHTLINPPSPIDQEDFGSWQQPGEQH